MAQFKLTDATIDLLLVTSVLGPDVTSRDVNTAREVVTRSEWSMSSTVATLAHLAECGLVTMKSNPQRWSVNPSVVATINPRAELPSCDLRVGDDYFHELAVADARTPDGHWGNVCSTCFNRLGCNLGLGKGQLYITAAELTTLKGWMAQGKCDGERTGHHTPECDAEADRRRNQS